MQQIPKWATRIAFVGVAIVLIFGVRAWWDWTQVQQEATEQNKRKFDVSLEFTKAIVGLIGTGATIAGGVVLYLNYKNAEEKLNHEKEKAEKDAKLAEARLITERFSKAVEQMGSEKMDIRIGGIYSLEQIAKDSAKYPDLQSYHWTVMEVLTAFIRERSSLKFKQDESQLQPVTTDVQAALTVIGRRDISRETPNQTLDLSFTNLMNADLPVAKLSGGKLDRANLQKATLQGANLKGVTLNRANLRGANLQDANLQEANLQDADLQEVDFQNASLHKVLMRGCNLQQANFKGTDLRQAYLDGVDLQGIQFGNANLQQGHFGNANIQRAIFRKANLQDAQFQRADLQDAEFEEANLEGTNFMNANLQGAGLWNTRLHKTNLRGANLYSADLTGSVGLTDEQLDAAKLCKTKLPDGTVCDRDCEELGLP